MQVQGSTESRPSIHGLKVLGTHRVKDSLLKENVLHNHLMSNIRGSIAAPVLTPISAVPALHVQGHPPQFGQICMP